MLSTIGDEEDGLLSARSGKVAPDGKASGSFGLNAVWMLSGDVNFLGDCKASADGNTGEFCDRGVESSTDDGLAFMLVWGCDSTCMSIIGVQGRLTFELAIGVAICAFGEGQL